MNRRFTQHEAFSLIEEYFQSGQRATDFYRSKNMSEWQFYKWRKLYLEVHPEHEASKTPPAKEPSLLQLLTSKFTQQDITFVHIKYIFFVNR